MDRQRVPFADQEDGEEDTIEEEIEPAVADPLDELLEEYEKRGTEHDANVAKRPRPPADPEEEKEDGGQWNSI